MLHDKSVRNKKSVKSACGKGKKPVKAAESYGWELDSSEAWEAYEFACEYFGKENLDDQIVSGLSTDELAESLVYIFRMNDFREWDERNGSSDDEEEKDWDDYDFALEDAEVGFDYFDDEVEYYREHKDELSEDDLYQVYEDANLFKKSDLAREIDEFIQEKFYSEDVEESVRAKGRKSVKASRKTNRKPVKASKLRKGKNRKAVTAAKLTVSFDEFKPWSGAVDTWNNLMDFGKIDLLEQIIDDTYYNEAAGEAILSETELNDLLWFEPETVYEWVGLYYNDETGEVSDEPFDEDDDEIEESVRAKGRKSVKASSKPLSTSEKKACIDQISYDYGVSKKQATEWYNSYSDERRRLILDGGKASAKKSFYND